MSNGIAKKLARALVLLLLAWPVGAQKVPRAGSDSRELSATQRLRLAKAYGRLPLSFEANEGQTDAKVRFLSRWAGQTLFLMSTEAVVTLGHSEAVRMKLLGADPEAAVSGLDRLPGNSNYFLGNDSTKWHTSVPTYAKVSYRQIYPGVDLVYYGNQRQLEYDFVVAPGADPGKIRMAVRGARKLSTDGNGNVVLLYEEQEIRLLRPHLYQDVDGQRIEIAGRYLVTGQELRFEIGRYDHHRILMIDPQLVYSTYLGGTSAAGDQAQAIAVDSSGNAYITGQTSSTDFPLSANAPQSAYGGGSSDAFVAKLNAAGNALVYSTYLGGSGIDVANGIAVDSTGSAYVAGRTNSANFPVSSALQSSSGGGYDAFVTKLSPAGNSLVYSTYLGGSRDESAAGIALDSSGNAYITGFTNSTDFPLSAPFQSTKGSGASLFSTAFVTKLNAAGNALAYSTYLGGSTSDTATGIAVDSAGNAYVTGYTNSTNFPLASPFQSTLKGPTNSFVSKLNAAGSALTYSTYLGGSSSDSSNAIAVDSSGNAYIAGFARSTDFPLSTPIQSSQSGTESAFITKFNSTGSGLVYSTYLGGTSVSYANGIAVDFAGNAYVTGNTNSADFPLSSPIQPVLGGALDVFVTALSPTGSAFLYSTFLGGNGFDAGYGIAVDAGGNAYVTGSTSSGNFPVSTPFQATLRGGGNAFVAKISPQSPPSPAGGTQATQTKISSSQNTSALGASVTFTATVTASSGTPTGTVAFLDNGTSFGSAPLTNGTATFSVSTLGLGPHSILAAYSGDSQFATSLSLPPVLQNVRASASTTTLVSSVQTLAFGQPITFTATVAGVGTTTVPTGNVVFNDGLNSLGTVALTASGTAALTTTSLSVAAHSITAVYQGNATFGGSTSTPLGIVVNPPLVAYSTNTIQVGTGPVAAALNPATHILFVANQGSNNVSAIDTRTNSVVTIPVGSAPSAIAINKITNQIYVANRDSADITVIDGATYNATSIPVASLDILVSPPSPLPFNPIAITVNEQTGEVFVGSSRCDLAVVQGTVVTHPGNFLCGPIATAISSLSDAGFVAESQDSSIEEYQARTDFLLNTPGFNDFIAPQALAIYAPFVFAADGAGRVDAINEIAGTSFQVTLGGNPYAIAVNPVDGEVYVASQSVGSGQAGTVSAVFVSANFGGVDAVLPVGQTPVPAPLPAPNKIAVDSTNDLVYVANEASNDVTVIDGSALAVNTAVPVGTNPRAVVLNTDRCNAYVTNFGSGTVSILTPQINGPGICLSSNWLIFPAQLLNTKSAPQTVTLTNIGNAPLLISSLATGPNAFIESDDCGPVLPATTNAIGPGAQCHIQVAFGPTVPGFVNGQILITDNNSGSPHTIVLTGNAVQQPVVTLTADANPAVFGQIITLTANVSGSLATPTGTVTFYDGPNVLSVIPLTNGAAHITPSLFAVGSATFTATYSGDLVYASASAPVLTETVNKASTQFAVFLSSSITSNAGDTVTFESAIQIVSPGSGNASEPGGQVTFYDGPSLLGSVPIKNGDANFSTSTLSAGSHSISASYPGDSNLLGGTSAVLTQVVNAQSGGGGTGGTGGNGGGTGGSGGCACTKTGNYKDPAVVDATVGTPSFATFLSPNSKYTLNASIDNTAKQTTIEVARNSDGAVVFPSQTFDFTTQWAFSPDDDRLVLHYIQPVPGQAGNSIDNYYVYDLSVTPARNIVYGAPNVVGSRLQFSPSGRYFIYTGLLGNQQTEIWIYRVQGVAQTHEPPIYDSGTFFFQVAPGTTFGEPGNSETENQQTGGVGWGFSPDKPETSFVYAYVTSPGIFQWVLVNLAAGTAKSYTYGGLGAPIISAFWQFDPCGDVAAVVTQPNTTQAEVDWYSTSTGRLLPGSNAVFALTSVTLETTSTGQEAVDSSGQLLGKTPSPCGQPNTPAPPPGAPASVTPTDPGSSTSPVTLIFSGVSQPGQTTLTINSTPPSPPTPNAFQLGNPPMYYNLSSTATFTPPVTICINYVGVSFNNKSAIAIYHFDNSQNPPAWVNITVPNSQITPPPPPNTVCGKSNSLSPFGLFEPAGSNPGNIVTSAGTPQTATVATAFVTPLQATVTGSSGNPLSGIQVAFSAPAAGATGSFGGATLAFVTTNASGVATAPTFTANGTAGSYSVTATVDGVAAPAIFSLTNVQILATTTAISAPTVAYGTPASVTVSVNAQNQTASGNATLSVDGGAPTTTLLSNGSATFNLGVLQAGQHALTANFASQGDFTSSSANATLTVAPAPLILTANSASKVYGAVLPTLGFNPSGFVNGDTTASLTTQPTLSTTATAASPVGAYAISIGGAVDANYTITYVPGTLTVTPAVVTITANNATKILNAPNPTLTWTPSRFVNGDTVSVLTANPNCTTAAGTNSPVGSYSITCSGANAANYTFVYVPGTLKIQYATAIGHVILPPINADGSSVFKQGRTVPAKFSVYDANGVSIGTPGVVSNFFLTGIKSGTSTAMVEDVVDTNNPDTAFRWDPTGQQWIFNITTGNLSAGSTYIYTITLNDGSTIMFQYGLR